MHRLRHEFYSTYLKVRRRKIHLASDTFSAPLANEIYCG